MNQTNRSHGGPRRRWTRLCAATALAAISAGCGSSDGSGAVDPDVLQDTQGTIDVQADADDDAATVDATSVDTSSQDTAASDSAGDTAAGDTTVGDDTSPGEDTTDVDDADAGDAAADSAADAADATDTTDAGGLDPDACTAEQACNNGAFCLVPGGFLGCGMCKKGEGCSADSECSGNSNGICVFAQSDCTCDGVPMCHDGCASDADCGLAEVCAADHHCKAAPCAADADCPTHFACDSSAKTCARKVCTASSACAGGHCVNGGCYLQPGSCAFPPP